MNLVGGVIVTKMAASISTSPSSATSTSTISKPSTRSSNAGNNVTSVYMKKIVTSPQPGGTKPKLTLAMLQDQINAQNEVINNQSDIINGLVLKVKMQEQELQRHVSLMSVKDCVFEALQKEVHRLQQYTRRYSVVVSGIEKKRGEKFEDLKKEIEGLVEKVQSSTTMEDVDKFHRNGPNRDGEQEVIVRFKSHSAKEAFYRKRKSDGINVKIRPSLSPNTKSLLNAAVEQLEEYKNKHLMMSNRPEFVFANIHGELQVKFQHDISKKRGMFAGFNSLQELACVIANAQNPDQDRLTHAAQAEFDDNGAESNSDDDMGFSLFD